MTEVVADRVPEPAEALASAESATGLFDWGADQSWRPGLDALLASARDDPSRTVRAGVRDEVERLLVIRLRLVADEQAEPGLVEVPIERPLFIVGFPRTGTSYLHELLALDPAARSPLAWESRTPWPAPELSSYDSDPRIAATQARYEALLAVRPEFARCTPGAPRSRLNATR